MKEITHEETRIVKITDGYISDDGIMFNSADECRRHEKINLIEKARKDCTALQEHSIEEYDYAIAESLYCSVNDTFYTFKPKSQKDIDRFEKYVEITGYDINIDVNHSLEIKDYFVFESEDNECIAVFSKEFVKNRYQKYIELMFKED